MSTRNRLLQITGFEAMSHRPPLAARYWFYAVSAYLIPVVAQIAFPEDPALTDELVWLVTLAPAFLLALHYGLKGAFAAMLMGTALFVAVQLVLALNFTPDDWRITLPTYIAYSGLAISVGWLSEELHRHYQQMLGRERMATIGQMAMTVKHELNNALTVVASESELLLDEGTNLTDEQRESVSAIRDSALNMSKHIDRITKLDSAPVTTWPGGIEMLDLKGGAPTDP